MTSALPKRTALVTGACGFVGAHLVRTLQSRQWDVHGLEQPAGQHRSVACPVHHHDDTFAGILDAVSTVRPDVVFHLAGLFIAEHKHDDVAPLIRSNVVFGTLLVEAMGAAGCTRLVSAGTSWQNFHSDSYRPVNLYAATKEALERIIDYYVDATALRAITLRLNDTYGPDDPRRKIIPLLLESARKQQTIQLSPGCQLVDFVHVSDVCDAFCVSAERLLAQNAERHERFSVSSGEVLPLKDLVEILGRALGSPLPVVWGGRQYREREVMRPWRGNPLPGWLPKIPLEVGLTDLASRFKRGEQAV